MVRFLQLTVLLGLSLASPALGAVVSFDDAWVDLDSSGDYGLYRDQVEVYYQGSHGLRIGGGYWIIAAGNGNGDPENFNLEGTAGSAFLGANDGIGTGPIFWFDSPVNSVSIDVGLPGFGWESEITVTGYAGATLVDTDTVQILSLTDPGNWATATLDGSVDRIEILLGAGNGLAFGVDNVQFEVTAIPEPASCLILLLGASGIVSRRRNRR